MAKGYQINGQSVLNTGVFIGVLAGLYWGGSALFGWISNFNDAMVEQNREQQALAEENSIYQGNTQTEINGLDYTLENASTIVVRNDNTTYRYDFQNASVLIDGPGEADRVILFSEYDDQSIVHDVRQVGCDLSANIVTSLEAFNETVGREHHLSETHSPLADSFLENNCLSRRPN